LRLAILALIAFTNLRAAETPLKPGETESFRLASGVSVGFRVELPAGAALLTLDSQRADAKEGALSLRVTIRSSDGTVIQQPVFEDTEVYHRGVCRFSAPRAGSYSIEIANNSDETNDWLTVAAARASDPDTAAALSLATPLFGTFQPVRLDRSLDQKGRLDKGEHAWFIAELAAGTYDVTLQFVNPNNYETSMAGALTLLDSDGDTIRTLIGLDTIAKDAGDREVLKLTRGGVYLFKLYNAGGPNFGYYRTDYEFTLSLRAAR
jgi:hypothetical protein